MAKGAQSSSSVATTSTSMDKRIAVESGIGISSDSSTITINALDAPIVNHALDAIIANDATQGASFSQLLGLADKLFTGAGAVIEKTQDTTLKQLDTINTAASNKSGAIDQKTMIVLAVAGAAVLILPKMRGTR